MTPETHLTPETIAAYLDGSLAGDQRDAAERHLLVCGECRQDLASASEQLQIHATRWVPPAAIGAAAAAVVAVVWLVGFDPPTSPLSEPVLRSAPTSSQLMVVDPADGSRMSADSLIFRWRSAGGSAHYEFTLTDDRGDVVFSIGQADTLLVLPREVGLAVGSLYFWVVDALLDGARSASSEFRSFVVE